MNIRFAAFDVSRTNTLDNNGNGAPIYGYNLFSVDQILRDATDNDVTSYEKIAEKGAIILMTSQWNCNLDKGESQCNPSWHYNRLDNENTTISGGYNFRTVTQFSYPTKNMYSIIYVCVCACV